MGWTVIFPFLSVVVSALGFGVACRSLIITKRQKEINERAYNLNLFKERFAVWNEFQDKKDVIIHLGKIFLLEENIDDCEELNKNVVEVENILKKIKFLFITKNIPKEYKNTISYIEYNTNIIENSKKYKSHNRDVECLEASFQTIENKKSLLIHENDCKKILEKSNIGYNDIINTKDETFFNNVNDLMQYYLKLDE